ncbi:hypothetical protein GYMLUDRAFT_181609 [Collybiopsis luxurians FD-317 M1]|uniref:Uncharacterized protein n=1 Tax=Collybiopsis luxurians FD-317 M1 TaxID=944289 RepID=A0A0D0BP18_9AGAR|nr:hypothetical protein GYMLUDRAFT_181609 [Collybiopsis luxurians FD-317 M1]
MEANGTLTIATNDSCDNIHQCRTLFQIVWSCVSVLIACTWVAIHPNVPSPREGVLSILARKVGLMIVTLIAPEVVVLWAARQWFSARELAKRHRDKGWSVSHGFLFLMGGFARFNGDDLRYVLRYPGLYERYGAHPEDLKFIGRIPKREIKDRSHSDGFAKFIAVGQTAWFVVQLIARKARHLPITELEIMTVAFAAMNVLIYFFWWYKPLGVGCHIRIQDHHSVVVQEDENGRASGIRITEAAGEVPSFDSSEAEAAPLLSGHAVSRKRVYSFWKQMRQTAFSIVWDIWEYLSYAASRKRVYSFWKHRATKWQIVGGILIAPFSIPITILINIIFEEHGAFYNHSLTKTPSFARTPRLEPSKKQDQYIAYGAAILFGAIHCIAWAFAFPSTVERVSWRIASVIVTCAPLCLAFMVYFGDPDEYDLPSPWDSLLGHTVFVFGLVLSFTYILSRITLIVLPFLALRDLPTGAFENVEWTSFIPHI